MLGFYLSMVESDEERSLIEFIYNEYRQLMYKTAFSILHNKFDAEDAVHEAFLRVIKNILKFRSYKCNENVSYLVIIVRGISLNMINKRNNSAELPDNLPDVSSVEEITENKISYENVKNNIEKLTPALKDIATLFFVEEMSAQEISELLDVNINTVRSSVHRAKNILKGISEVKIWMRMKSLNML